MQKFAAFALFTAGALSLIAQSSDAAKGVPPPKAAPKAVATSESPLDAVLPSWLKIGGQLRGRFEGPSDIGFVDAADNYYASRLRLDVTLKPLPWLTLFTQLQDARVLGYSQAPVAPTSFYNPADFRQAYIRVAKGEGTGFSFTAGRQEMNLGSGRLVAVRDFGNVSPQFDVLRMALFIPGVRADLFGGSPVLADSGRIDRHKPGEHLYGGYFTLNRLVPGATIDPYVMVKTNLGVAGENSKIGNAAAWVSGLRFAGTLLAAIDYSAEAMLQRGHYAQDHIIALGGTYALGWLIRDTGWKPRVALEYTYASGDKVNKDGVRGTFDQLYAGNHNYMGITDQTGLKNIRMPKALIEVTPLKKLKMTADFRELYLATVNDGCYLGNGTRLVLNRLATSPHVGSEIDLVASYQLQSSLVLSVGYGRLMPGQYLIDSKKPNTYNFPYVMWAKRF